MAFALPVEGEDGPYVGEAVAEPWTCGPDDPAGQVVERVGGVEAGGTVVVVSHDRMVVGTVEPDGLRKAEPDTPVRRIMALSPSTVRPSVRLAALDAGQRVLVTTPDGRLLGTAEGGDDETPPELARLQTEFVETVTAVQERFGDEEPSEEELRSFLRQRLLDQGATTEEADEVMRRLDQQGPQGPDDG